MTGERWERVKELVAAALELDGAAREAILAGEGDAAVQAEARSLLAADDPAFLPLPTAMPAAIGPYRIVRELGRGGMGAVYLGERTGGDFEQAVAIKLIKRGMDTDAILGRFREERRLQARLNHPNIVRLLDGGATEDGRPYFVMEFVDGQPLDVFCAPLDLRVRLGLFLTVCDAVEFAHRNLILHRDLKAANVLVDREGRPKLLDFGIAKALDSDTGLTQVGWRALTPEVASPEQMAGGALTTASDVYSLGKLLGKLAGGADGDLGLIVARATAAEVEERYATAALLREDLARYLAGEPVLARGGGWAYRAGKFVRRRWKSVAVAAVVVGALLFTGGTAIREGRRAERRFKEVRQLANSLLFELHDAIAPLEGSTEARALVVGKAIRYLDQLASEAGDDADLQRELAQSYLKLGQVQGSYFEANLGQVGDAHASFAKAVVLLEGVAKRQPLQVMVKAELAQALLRLASTENAAGRPEEALRLCDRALGLLWMPHWRAQLGKGMAHFGRAEAYLRLGRKEESTAAREQAIAIFAGLVAKDPANREPLRWLANASRRLGTEAGVARALEADEKLAALAPKDTPAKLNVAADHSYLGALAMRAGKLTEAERELGLALGVLRTHCAADSKDVRARGSLVHNLALAGQVEAKLGHAGAARELLREAELAAEGLQGEAVEELRKVRGELGG